MPLNLGDLIETEPITTASIPPITLPPFNFDLQTLEPQEQPAGKSLYPAFCLLTLFLLSGASFRYFRFVKVDYNFRYTMQSEPV